ncbi:type I polyketide synthase [Brevibacillus sp. HD1.4A]|uniref:type I polyketide synthase n=1 Tax=Brevibacillus sp. HD1.4A TaxID=2738978 RepID=UPI00156B6A69|nr:type I polyketide synthase [Brevibacillus sp. HD1.4A]NRQ55291.1 KR domain-containing protein [Brevibacillus sp. HD1.4A]
MTAVEQLIFELVASQKIHPTDAAALLAQCQKLTEPIADKEIAIIGMAGKFPKGENLARFWEQLKHQQNCIDEFPDSRVRDCIDERLWGKNDKNQWFFKGGYLERIDQFDPGFFQISPVEAKFMDPMQRLMLETSYQAIEDAGYYYKELSGTNTGVYIGTDHTWGQWYRDNAAEKDPLLLSGTWSAILSSRISYWLNAKGPSLVIDTSCSSGLVAVHEACRAIQSGVCDMAIAGGIHLNYSPIKNPMLGLVESEDYLIRTFDKRANGTVWGEGVGVVILKPLQHALRDRDHIYGVIKGSAVNNDGTSDGITAPNSRAQEEVICQAWQEAGVAAEAISYIEAHGTGTKLGDSIEIDGLVKAFSRHTKKKQFCAIGTVKTNIGHTVGASGLASLLKVMLAIRQGQLPASINFLEANPFIDFFASPVYVNDRLQEWTTAGEPRIAGISSFGFSGTNCHMVVGEVPARQQKPESVEPSLYLLPLSAKDEAVLFKLVEEYVAHLSQNRELDLEDLCYTASTGRGHYSHRLAIIFTSYDDLLAKLGHLKRHGLAPAEQVLYQVHEIVVSGGAPEQQHGAKKKWTEREKQELSRQGEDLLTAKTAQGKDASFYLALGELYVLGAAIDWKRMYDPASCSRLSLPVYPFQKTRCWVESSSQGYRQAVPQTTGHPLLRGTTCDSLEQTVYTTSFSVATDWVVSEHRVGSEYVLPGTAYIELLLEVGRQQGGLTVIKELAFLQPFSLQEGQSHELQITLKKADGEHHFYIASKDQTDGSWRKHAEGKLCRPMQEQKRVDLAALQKAFPAARDTPDLQTDGGFITTGAHWNNIKELRVGEKECLVAIELSESQRAEAAHYHYHPAMLDNAANIAIRSIDEQLYLPFYYQEIRVYGPIPSAIYSYVRQRELGEGNQTATFDIDIVNPAGEVLVEIEGYTIKQVRTQLTAASYYEKDWIVQEVQTASPAPEKADETVVVFTGEGELAERLRQQLGAVYGEVIEVGFGKEAGQVKDREDYHHLWPQWQQQAKKVRKIIHLLSMTDARATEAKGFDDAEQRGFYSLYYLLDSLSAQPSNGEEWEIILVGDYANRVTGDEITLRPEHGCLLGLGKVAREEFPHVRIRFIDVDAHTDPHKVVEEFAVAAAPYQVAYRHNQRYVERLQETTLAAAEDRDAIKANGVYLITGGTGGLGLEIGKQLSRLHPVNLHLISRQGLPARETWTEIEAAGTDQQRIQQIASIREMEKQGASVQIHAADISEESQLRQLLETIRTESGAIHGVIHCAGVAGEGLLVRKPESRIREVLAAKVKGTRLLDQLTEADNLDFFVMFSSMHTVTGGIGQSDYVAANSYLDLYAAYMRQAGRKALTINWPLWREVGMGQAYQADNRQSLFESLTPRQGAAIFTELLHAEQCQIIVGQLKRRLAKETIGHSLVHDYVLGESIERAVTQAIGSGSHPADSSATETAIIKEADHQEITAWDQEIAHILARVLGLEEISIFANFEDLGGNSLLAVRLQKELDAAYPGVFMISDIFSYPTVHDMAAYLERKRATPAKRSMTIEQIMNDLEQGTITADEADLLIREISEQV